MALAALASLLVLALTVPTSPLRIRRRIAAEVEAPEPEPAPEPKVPCDTSRTYPRPKGSRSKLNRVCPVCGTGQETGNTGNLDGRVLGWPAHRTCAEWLGDWKPPPPEIKELQRALDGFKDHRVPVVPPARSSGRKCYCNYCRGRVGVHGEEAVALYRAECEAATHISISGSPGAQVNVGDGNAQVVWSESGTPDPVVLIANGMASIDEVRARLDREIAASFTVPPGVLEEHTHKVGDPLPTVRCACGAQFIGTPDYLRTAMETHRQAGCRQSSSSLPA